MDETYDLVNIMDDSFTCLKKVAQTQDKQKKHKAEQTNKLLKMSEEEEVQHIDIDND